MEFNDRRARPADSRELQKGDRVRIHTGREGEGPVFAGSALGMYSPTWEGTVTSVNQHAVHFKPSRYRQVYEHRDTRARQVTDSNDGGIGFAGNQRLRHDAISRVEHL